MDPASGTPKPPSSEPPDTESRTEHAHREQAAERHAETQELYGPLDVERHVKDDGRALILYSRRTGGPA